MRNDVRFQAPPLVHRYARALFTLAVKSNLTQQVQDDLTAVDGALREHQTLRKTLYHPLLPVARKQALLAELFAARVQPLTAAFLRLLLEKKRLTILPALLKQFQALHQQEEKIITVRVTTATALSPVQSSLTRGRLARILKRQVHLETYEDPNLLGGIVIQIGFRMIDGSCRGQLNEIRRRMLA